MLARYTGSEDVTQLRSGLELSIEYQFDGEPTPSVAYNPAMACGNKWPAVELGGEMLHTQLDVGKNGLFSAGDKCGQGSEHSAWWNNFKFPFQRSVVVTVRAVVRDPELHAAAQEAGTAGINLYCIVRGFEDVTGRGLTLPSGATLPLSARMELQKLRGVAVPALGFAPLARLPAGQAGVLSHVTMAVETSPPWTPANSTANNFNSSTDGPTHVKSRNNWIVK